MIIALFSLFLIIILELIGIITEAIDIIIAFVDNFIKVPHFRIDMDYLEYFQDSMDFTIAIIQATSSNSFMDYEVIIPKVTDCINCIMETLL